MNQELKKNINWMVPLGVATLAGFFFFKKGKDYKFILAMGVVIFGIAWVITRQTTKMIQDATESPDHVNVDPDVAGSIDVNFSPGAYTDRLKNDIYSYGWRDASIYADLVKLSSASLTKVYNDWNERYYSVDSETMIQAMEGESYGNNWTDNVAAHAATIIARLKEIVQ